MLITRFKKRFSRVSYLLNFLSATWLMSLLKIVVVSVWKLFWTREKELLAKEKERAGGVIVNSCASLVSAGDARVWFINLFLLESKQISLFVFTLLTASAKLLLSAAGMYSWGLVFGGFSFCIHMSSALRDHVQLYCWPGMLFVSP